MGRPSLSPLKVIEFQPKLTPRYLNAKHLPSSQQLKLSEIVTRFDRLMKERPTDAGQILIWAEQILQIYGA